ncbi:hypothetical protein KI387_027682, partial [Taxus chinensis]
MENIPVPKPTEIIEVEDEEDEHEDSGGLEHRADVVLAFVAQHNIENEVAKVWMSTKSIIMGKYNCKQQQRHLNVGAASGSPFKLQAINGDSSLAATWQTPSASGNPVAGMCPAGHGYGYGTYLVCGTGMVRLGYSQQYPEVPKTMAETATVEMRLGNVGLKNTVAASPLASKTNAGIIRETPKESELPDLKGAGSQVAQRVISQLMTLATIDPDADILVFINSPGGSIYSVFAIYDCMSWIKPKVGTVCFGVAASHTALILAGGEKGMRYAMPNSRVMIHQPQGSVMGNILKVRPQVDELASNQDKIDKMYAQFTGQPLELVKYHTDRDRFFSAAE